MALFILPFTKICTKCKSELSLDGFHKNLTGLYGVDSKCKLCKNKQVQKYQSIIGINKAERFRKWRETNPEKYKASVQKYYSRTRKTQIEKVNEWRKHNPEKRSENNKKHKHRRRSLLSNIRQDLTLDQWNQIKDFYRHRCAFCGEKTKLTQDHVMPISKGGEHTASNIIPLCQPCNSSKGNRPITKIFQPHLFMISK